MVVLNRQPTLHAGSMMAMRVVPRRGTDQKTITMNLAITSSFNADFDGDEMNLHAPHSFEALAELQELSSVKNFIITPQSSSPNVIIVQDSLLGAYTMTKGHQKIDKGRFFDICTCCPSMDMKYIKDKLNHIRRVRKELGLKPQAFNGKGLFSMILPSDFNYTHENRADPDEPEVKIYKGVLYEGAITKANLGKSKASLILYLNKEYPVQCVCDFIDNVQFVTNQWNLIFGFSVGLGDCIATKKEEIDYEIKKCLIEAEGVESTTHDPEIREIRVSAALNKARDIGQRISKDGLGRDNNFLKSTTSGSKGDFFNISQITSLLGQQYLGGKRIPLMLNQETRSLPHYSRGELSMEEKYESRGFISSSFIKGLNPKEYFFHAMGGRLGVCDRKCVAKSTYVLVLLLRARWLICGKA